MALTSSERAKAVKLINKGWTSQKIAEKTGLSVRSIGTLRGNLTRSGYSDSSMLERSERAARRPARNAARTQLATPTTLTAVITPTHSFMKSLANGEPVSVTLRFETS